MISLLQIGLQTSRPAEVWKERKKERSNMKRIFVLTLIFALLLSGCGGTTAETTAPVTEAPTEAATEPTTVPTEPPVVYRNPLNGEILDEPYTGRIIAHTVTNTQDAIPHVGVNECDMIFEAYVSRGVVRCLAFFTDISDVEAIGATRSTRLIFNQLADNYDAITIHGGGFSQVLQDANIRGLDHFNVDSLYRQGDPYAKATAYRDKEYKREAPNNLFGYGPGIVAYLESQNVRLTQPADKDYGLTFTDDATPADGEIADEILIEFGQNTKTTTMVYDEAAGKYVWNQYGKEMTDQITGEKEAFNNVIILQADTYENYIYQEANFHVGGFGYYACGGKIIPIDWECIEAPEPSPFRITTKDGESIDINVGNSYVAVLSYTNKVEWKEVIPLEPVFETTAQETAAETVAEAAPTT